MKYVIYVCATNCYELAWMRCRKIGYIFQTFNLIPVMTALENVTLPMIFAGMFIVSSRAKDSPAIAASALYASLRHGGLCCRL